MNAEVIVFADKDEVREYFGAKTYNAVFGLSCNSEVTTLVRTGIVVDEDGVPMIRYVDIENMRDPMNSLFAKSVILVNAKIRSEITGAEFIVCANEEVGRAARMGVYGVDVSLTLELLGKDNDKGKGKGKPK